MSCESTAGAIKNPTFEPVVPDPKQLSILGQVVEVRRYLPGR